jgi:hypothetical protein
MSQHSSSTLKALSLPADPARPSHAPLADAPVPPSPPRPPTLLSRVGRYALVLGGVCAAFGAVEGALVGFLLAPSKEAGALVLAVAVDRCILLGLLGAGIGAVVGVFDWRRGSRKKKGRS